MPFGLEVDGVVEWLKSKDVIVPNDWVSACLDWISSENQGSIMKEKVRQMVYEQWLYTNLRELDVRTLPDSIQNDVSSLTGCYCLQVESVLDVSQSKDQTNEDMKHAPSSNTQNKWEKKAARLLMLNLCDGVKTVNAIELKPIACLSENINLGSKVRIKGPVKCRRGVILLEPSNVDFLGGEVEDFLEASGENQPARNTEVSESSHIVSLNPQFDERNADTNDSVQPTTQNASDSENRSASNPSVPSGHSSHGNHILKQSEPTIISLISDDEDEEIIKCLEETEATSNSHIVTDTGNEKDNILLSDGTNRPEKDSLNVLRPDRTSGKPNSPTEYLCYCQRYLKQKLSVIRVKAVVTTLLSKLKYDSVMGWSVKALICDGTATLEVDFSHEVLLSLIGHSGDFDSLSPANPELKYKLKNCQNTVMSLCHYMNVNLRSIGSCIVGSVLKIEGL